jgi:hypothetical protein
MHLGLSDVETAALTRLLTNTSDADRFPLSPRIQTLKAIPRALAATESISAAASRN